MSTDHIQEVQMDDTERVTRLEDEIGRLETELDRLRGQLALAELDHWRGRIDDLEVQARLMVMEADDRVAPLLEQVRNRWLEAKDKVTASASTAGEVIETLRDGMEQAVSDLRGAILAARSAATR